MTADPRAAGEPSPASAWKRYEPDAERPWDLARAAHLFRRTTFGADWNELERAIADGPQRTIDRLLRPDADTAAFDAACDRDEATAALSGSADALRAWWLRRMIRTPHRLRERLTLFWHGHFATSIAQVKSATLMHRTVGRLRENALGSFAALLAGNSTDPALLIGHDAAASRKARPSIGYVRALLEHHTLGPDGYSESDLREAARAFTGGFILRGKFRSIPREHDGGVKRVLGREGRFDAKGVLQVVLEHPGTARHVVRSLYRFLVSETSSPSDELIAPLAEAFGRGGDIAAVVETIVRSDLFFSDAAYRQRVKSPVDLALGVVKAFEEVIGTARLGDDLEALGQSLFEPPNAAGWAGGRHWVRPLTLVARHNLAAAMLAAEGPYGGKLDPAAVAAKHGRKSPDDVRRFLKALLVGGDVSDESRRVLNAASSNDARSLAHLVATLPEFQLS